MRRAIELRQFELHYQPKVDLRDARLRGLEALICWHHPEHGLQAPGTFISVLEDSGLILKVGRWVMAEAAEQHRRWRRQGLRPPRIAVNVSPLQLRHPSIVDDIMSAIAEDPRGEPSLDIEITEGVFMEHLADSVQKLHAVRQLGVKLAIDDFGTGFSSLAYLARLPVDFLKIDQVFVNVMTENPNDMAIVSSIISLAHGLNLQVIAEGVETVEQRKLLQLLRCDQMQGFLFSSPVTMDKVEELLVAQDVFCDQHAAQAQWRRQRRRVSRTAFCESSSRLQWNDNVNPRSRQTPFPGMWQCIARRIPDCVNIRPERRCWTVANDHSKSYYTRNLSC